LGFIESVKLQRKRKNYIKLDLPVRKREGRNQLRHQGGQFGLGVTNTGRKNRKRGVIPLGGGMNISNEKNNKGAIN